MRPVLYRGKWCATWTEDGVTKRRSLRIGGNPKDRALAERVIVEARKQPMGDTVEAIMEAYLSDRDGKAIAANRLRDAWKALQSTFAPLRPEQIDGDLCAAYAKRRRKQGRGDGTIRKELSTLRTALRWGKADPASFELPPAPPPRDRYLTREEYDAFVEAATDPHIRLFIILAVATAGRAQAILSLTWDRVDFQRGVIRLSDGTHRGKGRATVPMTNRAREALLEAREASLSDYVIEYAGGHVKSVKKGFATAASRAGIEGVTPHVLRHTSAVWMAESGVPMSEIAQYLGHSDDRITQRVYARYSPEHLRRAAKALD